MNIHPRINTLEIMIIASDQYGYASMEPSGSGNVRLVAVSHSGNIATAPFYVNCRNHKEIVAMAARLLEAIR